MSGSTRHGTPTVSSRLRDAWQRMVLRTLGRLRAGEHTFTIITAIVLGVLAGYGAISFRLLISLVHRLFFTTTEYSLDLLHELAW